MFLLPVLMPAIAGMSDDFARKYMDAMQDKHGGSCSSNETASSIPKKNLEFFMKLIAADAGIDYEEATSFEYQQYFLKNNMWVAGPVEAGRKAGIWERAHSMMYKGAPAVVITYKWGQKIKDIVTNINSIDEIGPNEAVWWDCFILDQRKKDLTEEIKLTQALYKDCKHHVVMSLIALTRAWCLLEICTRLAAVKNEGKHPPVFRASEAEMKETFDKRMGLGGGGGGGGVLDFLAGAVTGGLVGGFGILGSLVSGMFSVEYNEFDLASTNFFEKMDAREQAHLDTVKATIREKLGVEEFNYLIREYAIKELTKAGVLDYGSTKACLPVAKDK